MSRKVQGGPYSVIVGGKNENGRFIEMVSFNDLDHMQAKILGTILSNVIEGKEVTDGVIEMSQSEINECIIDRVLGKYPLGSGKVCLTKMDIVFDLKKHSGGSGYVFQLKKLNTNFQKGTTEKCAWWQKSLEFLTHHWLSKILLDLGVQVLPNVDLLKEAEKVSKMNAVEFPQIDMPDYRQSLIIVQRAKASNNDDGIVWSDNEGP